MKNLFAVSLLLTFLSVSAQDHFSGINTSRRTGILNGSINPAELANLNSKYEVNFLSVSINASNNKVGFDDLVKGRNIQELIFTGSENANLRVDAELYGPGIAMKVNEWAFAFTTKAYAKLNFIDIDPQLGDAIHTGTLNSLYSSASINSDSNQRLIATSWGELGFSVARTIYENERHKFNGGATLKLLFPGSYANFGLDQFHGTIENRFGQAYVNNTSASLNIAYSGNFGNSFTNFQDYSQSLFGPINGVAADFGFNYQWKDLDKNYKINAGVSVRNIGGMTFKDVNNASTNYELNIPQGTLLNPGLNLNQFQNVTSIQEAETKLQESGYLTNTKQNNKFKVKLPTIISAYADVKMVSRFYLTFYTQRKLHNDDKNDQVTTQNIFSVTPRFYLKNYEVYSSWSDNEISKITGGIGFRVYGFYLGSSSIITALTSNTKQADFYVGYRAGFK